MDSRDAATEGIESLIIKGNNTGVLITAISPLQSPLKVCLKNLWITSGQETVLIGFHFMI